VSMTRFYLVRHGNTNAGDRLVGRTEGFPLSENGREQINYIAGKYLKQVKFDKFLCSPIERTRESARIICGYINMEPEVNQSLNEIDFGEWTGKSFDELEKDQNWKLFHSSRSTSQIPGGESIGNIYKRVVDLIVELNQSFPEGSVLLVTHAEVIRIIFSHFSGMHLNDSYKIRIDTGSLSILSINNGGAFIESINLPGSDI